MTRIAAIVFGFALAMGINAAWSATVTHGSDLASGDIGPALLDPADDKIRYSHQRPTTLITTNTVTFVGGDTVDLSSDLGGGPLTAHGANGIYFSGTATNTSTITVTSTSTNTSSGTNTGNGTGSGTGTGTSSQTVTVTANGTVTNTGSATATVTARFTSTATGTSLAGGWSNSASYTQTSTNTGIRTVTITASNSTTLTETYTATGYDVAPSETVTFTSAATGTLTGTISGASTAAVTGNATGTVTGNLTGTVTGIGTGTGSGTGSGTPTATATQTSTFAVPGGFVGEYGLTRTATKTYVHPRTATWTVIGTGSWTGIWWFEQTATFTYTDTATKTRTASGSVTAEGTTSLTGTRTATGTVTGTVTGNIAGTGTWTSTGTTTTHTDTSTSTATATATTTDLRNETTILMPTVFDVPGGDRWLVGGTDSESPDDVVLYPRVGIGYDKVAYPTPSTPMSMTIGYGSTSNAFIVYGRGSPPAARWVSAGTIRTYFFAKTTSAAQLKFFWKICDWSIGSAETMVIPTITVDISGSSWTEYEAVGSLPDGVAIPYGKTLCLSVAAYTASGTPTVELATNSAHLFRMNGPWILPQ